jgi:hypothetical protein
MDWMKSKDDSQRIWKCRARDYNPKTSNARDEYEYEVITRPGEGWLCACALLGMKRTYDLMKRRTLRLEELEMMVRSLVHKDLFSKGAGYKKGAFSEYISKDIFITKLVPVFAELGFSKYGFEKMIQAEDARDEYRKKKRGAAHNEFRSLRSWLLDEAGEPGEKLRIALNPKDSTRDDRARRLKQLKQDSATIVSALRQLTNNPLKVRRQKGANLPAATSLAKFSLEQEDKQDEQKVALQEDLLRDLEKLRQQEKKDEMRLKETMAAISEFERIIDFIYETGPRDKTGKLIQKNPPSLA